MSLRDEERGLIVIGEAALYLALTDKEIDINSLMEQLKSMATGSCSDNRLCKIFEAISWLKSLPARDLRGSLCHTFILSIAWTRVKLTAAYNIQICQNTPMTLPNSCEFITSRDGLYPVCRWGHPDLSHVCFWHKADVFIWINPCSESRIQNAASAAWRRQMK